MKRRCSRCGFRKSELHYNTLEMKACIQCLTINEMDYGSFDPRSININEFILPETEEVPVRYEINKEGKTCMIIQSKL